MTISHSTFRISVWLGLCFLLTACSQDKHVYYSSVDRPTNVTVYDPYADKPLWIKEIPVGQTLEIDFDRSDEKEWQSVTLKPADQLTWNLYQGDTNDNLVASDRVRLPGTPVMIKVSYRPSPEYPAR